MNDDIQTTGAALIALLPQRPIAYNPEYSRHVGVTAAVMLSQMVYWSQMPTVAARGGWFYKKAEEWTEETGLSVKEQGTARKRLREAGFIHEKREGIPCKLWFKVNASEVLLAITNARNAMVASLAESAKQGKTDQPNKVCPSGVSSLTQSATLLQENTTGEYDKPRAPADAALDSSSSSEFRNENGQDHQPSSNHSESSDRGGRAEIRKGDDGIPPCPHEKIIAIWGQIMPDKLQPNPAYWRGRKREKDLEDRWKEQFGVLHSKTGKPLYVDEETGLEWWAAYFQYLRQSDFLMNKLSNFDLEWVIDANHFARIMERKYHEREQLRTGTN